MIKYCNIDDEEETLQDFLFERNVKNLVKEKTCFKSIDNPSCIDLFLTNTPLSFQNTTAVTIGLSDFHKMAVTVMKTTFLNQKLFITETIRILIYIILEPILEWN